MISELPSSIVEIILTLLPLRDAVRTSILSKKWRYQWAQLPQLVFDDTLNNPTSREDPRDIVLKIYEILLLHQGPISKFTLDTLDISGLTRCSAIDKLILSLSRKHIQDFTICVSKGKYKLPSCFFSCLKLRHVSLHSCVFKPPPTFKGFSKLISLELKESVLPPDVSISNCPLLESLTLESNTVIDSFSIDAPYLKTFVFRGIMNCFSFTNTPLLAKLSLASDGEPIDGDLTSYLVNVFGDLPLVEHLLLEYTYLELLEEDNVPKKLPTHLLNSLRHLELNAICFTEMGELSRTLCLIRSSPNLQKLWIQVSEGSQEYEKPALKYLEMQDYSDVSLDRLCEVQFRNIAGLRPELEFIKFILAKSPALEKMHIRRATRKIDVNYVNMLIEVTRFRRASQKAEIIFPPSKKSDKP